MCTLHLFYRVFPDIPVLFAANRDENLDRPWHAPAVLSREPWIYGPRDLTAGGTWLGVNRAGVLVSLANHQGTLSTGGSTSPCSRGAVVLATLRQGRVREAVEYAAGGAPACKSYTLLVADADSAYVVDHREGDTQTFRLSPGCHVITNARFRDSEDPKARRCLERMGKLVAGPTPGPEEMFPFLCDHESAADTTTPLCIHPTDGSRFGTSSASVVAITPEGQVRRFWFTPGPPCTTPPEDYTPPPV